MQMSELLRVRRENLSGTGPDRTGPATRAARLELLWQQSDELTARLATRLSINHLHIRKLANTTVYSYCSTTSNERVLYMYSAGGVLHRTRDVRLHVRSFEAVASVSPCSARPTTCSQ